MLRMFWAAGARPAHLAPRRRGTPARAARGRLPPRALIGAAPSRRRPLRSAAAAMNQGRTLPAAAPATARSDGKHPPRSSLGIPHQVARLPDAKVSTSAHPPSTDLPGAAQQGHAVRHALHLAAQPQHLRTRDATMEPARCGTVFRRGPWRGTRGLLRAVTGPPAPGPSGRGSCWLDARRAAAGAAARPAAS